MKDIVVKIVSMPRDEYDRFVAEKDNLHRKIEKLNVEMKSLNKRLVDTKDINKERAAIIDKLATQLEQAQSQTIEMWTIDKFAKYRKQLEATLQAFHRLIAYDCGSIANNIITTTIADIEECLKE